EQRLRLLMEMAIASDTDALDEDIASRWTATLDRWTNLTGNKEDALNLMQFVGHEDSLRTIYEEFLARLDDIRPWFVNELLSVDDCGALRRLTVVVPSALDEDALESARDEFETWVDGEVYDIIHQGESVDDIDGGLDALRGVAEEFDVDLD